MEGKMRARFEPTTDATLTLTGVRGALTGETDAIPTAQEKTPLRASERPDVYWRAFTPDTSDEEVRAAFRQRYGCPPAEVRRVAGGIVLVGPVTVHQDMRAARGSDVRARTVPFGEPPR